MALDWNDNATALLVIASTRWSAFSFVSQAHSLSESTIEISPLFVLWVSCAVQFGSLVTAIVEQGALLLV